MEWELSKVAHLLHLKHRGPQSLSQVHLACASLLQSAKTQTSILQSNTKRSSIVYSSIFSTATAVGSAETFYNVFPLPLTLFFIFTPEALIFSAVKGNNYSGREVQKNKANKLVRGMKEKKRRLSENLFINGACRTIQLNVSKMILK